MSNTQVCISRRKKLLELGYCSCIRVQVQQIFGCRYLTTNVRSKGLLLYGIGQLDRPQEYILQLPSKNKTMYETKMKNYHEIQISGSVLDL